MRRALSISLILLLCLPAVAAMLPGAGEVRLPFCCRRQGAHHCAMDANSAQNNGSDHIISAPSRCPQFPAAPVLTRSSAFVPTTRAAIGPALVFAAYLPGPRRDAARPGRLRAQLDRGPPSSAIA